jgi:hypothetical protein
MTDETMPSEGAMASEPPESAPRETSGVFVPSWVGVLILGVVIAVVFGGIGFVVGDSSGSESSGRVADVIAGPGGRVNWCTVHNGQRTCSAVGGSNGGPVQVPANGRVVQVPANGRVVQVPANGRVVQVPANGRVEVLPGNR